MRIHKGATVEEHAVAEIDSLTFYEHTSGPVLVQVPAGSFTMGDGQAVCGIDQRTVILTRGFALGQHEVTNKEYVDALQWAYDHGHVTATASSVLDNLDGSTVELVSLASPYSEIQFDGAGHFSLRESPSSFAQNAYPAGYDPTHHPVTVVSWYGAARYCDWLSMQAGLPRAYQHAGDWSCNGGDPYGAVGYRLPTDAEWEYASQWDDDRAFPWGNEAPACGRLNYRGAGSCVGWTSPVGSYPPAPASLGLADVAGNVQEWCNDWSVCDLGAAPATDPTGPASGVFRVVRGGAWFSLEDEVRCAARNYQTPDNPGPFGFRVARTIGG